MGAGGVVCDQDKRKRAIIIAKLVKQSDHLYAGTVFQKVELASE